jgi:hypothetical protein
MELKTYTTENSSRMSSGKPRITLSAKNGVIRLNKVAVESLKIKDRDKWSLSQDMKNVKEWYLHVNNENGFPVRVSSRGEATLSNKSVCEDIRACVKNINDEKACKMYIIIEPIITKDEVLLYPVLTSSAH